MITSGLFYATGETTTLYKHAISISIVGLSLGVTSMFEKLILLYHYCLHTLNMLLRRFANRISYNLR